MQLCWLGSNHSSVMYRSRHAPSRIRAPSRNVGHLTRVGTLHGQCLLGHSVPPLAQRRNPQPVVQHRFLLELRKLDPKMSISTPVLPRLFPRASDYSHPRNLYSHARNPYSHPPGILILIAPESLFTCPGIRNCISVFLPSLLLNSHTKPAALKKLISVEVRSLKWSIYAASLLSVAVMCHPVPYSALLRATPE
jgi:hypothetical protein